MSDGPPNDRTGDGVDRAATTDDVCERFNVSKPAISTWVNAGCPHAREGHGKRAPLRFDLEEVSLWVKTHRRGLGNGGDRRSAKFRHGDLNATSVDKASLSAIELEHAEAKLRKDLAAAEKAELELDRLHGRLLDADEVKQGQLTRIQRARAVLLGIPSSLADELAETDDPQEVRAILLDRVHTALTALADAGDEEE